MSIVVLPSRGAYTLTTTDLDGPGNENPRLLSGWAQAVERADVADMFDAYCLVDTQCLQQTYDKVHATPNAAFDLSQTSDWTNIVWARTIQPWLDTVAEELLVPDRRPSAPRFLDGLVDSDWLFIEKLDHEISLQIGAGTYLSAQLGGGGAVHTDAANAQIWEGFTFDDLNGGTLVAGDVVDLQTYDGLYLTVGAGQVVSADQRVPSTATRFTIVVQGAGALGRRRRDRTANR